MNRNSINFLPKLHDSGSLHYFVPDISLKVLSDKAKKQEYDTFGMGGPQARTGGFRAQQGFSGV